MGQETGRTDQVAPHAGARIETSSFVCKRTGLVVAPHAGARIETSAFCRAAAVCLSLPMRERELKPAVVVLVAVVPASLPMRERELKPFVHLPIKQGRRVAPHAGARIETIYSLSGTCT